MQWRAPIRRRASTTLQRHGRRTLRQHANLLGKQPRGQKTTTNKIKVPEASFQKRENKNRCFETTGRKQINRTVSENNGRTKADSNKNAGGSQNHAPTKKRGKRNH
jgi:hypothetical protein